MNHIKILIEVNMKTLKHTTAKASYYDTRAELYDEFNENNSRAINALLENILKEHHMHITDMPRYLILVGKLI